MARISKTKGTEVAETIDQFIRSGQILQAREALSRDLEALASRGLVPEPRRWAEFCRRVGWQDRAVRLLNPIVRPLGRVKRVAEPEDVIEYSANLTFLGAVPEALDLLKEIDPVRYPKAQLFRAFAHFSRWEYCDSVPLLEAYVREPSLTEYEVLVGELNLLSALVNVAEAPLAIERSESFLRRVPEKSLLWTNALEIRAQALMLERQFREARRALELIASNSQIAGASYGLFIEKWTIILDLYEAGVSRKSLRALQTLAAKSLAARRWEVARDCDYHRALFSNDERLARKLWFGTPYAAYRTRIRECFGLEVEDGETYPWEPLGRAPKGCLLDVAKGRAASSARPLKRDQLPHKLLGALCSDFYRPPRVASLFAELFPGEHWHPVHSAGKTNQVVTRLRKWLASEFPIASLRSRRHYFELSFDEPVALVVGSRATNVPGASVFFDTIEAGEVVSIEELQTRLGLPRRTLQRKVASAVEAGLLRAVGATRNRRYSRAR